MGCETKELGMEGAFIPGMRERFMRENGRMIG